MQVCQVETIPSGTEAHFVTPLKKPEVRCVCEQFTLNGLYVTETDSWNMIPRACQNAMRKFRCVWASFVCVCVFLSVCACVCVQWCSSHSLMEWIRVQCHTSHSTWHYFVQWIEKYICVCVCVCVRVCVCVCVCAWVSLDNRLFSIYYSK
jgi:hypothetical protein